MNHAASRAGPSPLVVALAVMILCGIWGSTWFVIKAGLRDLPVLSSAATRFTLAALVFTLLAPLLHRREGGERPAWWLSLGMGLLNFAISYGIVYMAETVIPSGLTSVLWAVFPMMTAALAHRFLPGERLGARQWLGFCVGLGGVAVLFATDLRRIGGEALWTGAFLLLSPLSAAAGQVLVKRHGPAVSATLLNRNGMIVGATALWLVALPLETQSSATFTGQAVAGLAYLALVGTVVSFGLYYWLLRYVDASRLSLIAYVTPALALWLGWAAGDEPLTRSTIGGSALILLGIALALGRHRRRASDHAPSSTPASNTPDR
ncbi:DMT family transporter [Paraliomyxa miuraensis]|uniref:DMT family transporter n=1 Tax=Paraliomyxa miuraensis TaxID=376150 RepID=UPI00225A48FF|nr:EamA family transporter [Paraliomyxa miuraensis]MCX4242394.1 EamA family transporter [Paraliomyxa miuraensis]